MTFSEAMFLLFGICAGLLLGHVINACALKAAFKDLKKEQKQNKRRDPADWWKDGDEPFGVDYEEEY